MTRYFSSYKDARKYYKLADNELCIEITNHPNSIERILNQGNIIEFIGIGSKKFPGYPSGNQIFENQLKLIHKIKKDSGIPVFNKLMDNKVIFLGIYHNLIIMKKMAFNGFMYYEFRMHRQDIKIFTIKKYINII